MDILSVISMVRVRMPHCELKWEILVMDRRLALDSKLIANPE
ncbi:hypothetical protein ACFLU9_02545 [Chloroflexota bacterium]